MVLVGACEPVTAPPSAQPVDAAVPAEVVPDAAVNPPAPDAAPVVDVAAPADLGAPDLRPLPDAAPDLGRDATPDLGPDGPQACLNNDACPRGFNCHGGGCVAATASCATEKAADPTVLDGLYWLSPGGAPLRAYCDMRQTVELCSEMRGDHKGVMRDPMALPFTMTSVLEADGSCRFYNLRGPDDYPIGFLARGNPPQTEDTCKLMGFPSLADIGSCEFGSNPGNSDCGYRNSRFFRYGTICSDCATNSGEYAYYVLQGPVHAGKVIGTVDGRVSSRCRTR